MVAIVYCCILSPLFLSASIFNTAAAFVSKPPLLKPPRQAIQSDIKSNHRRLLKVIARRQPCIERDYASTDTTSSSSSSSLRALPSVFGTVEWSDVLYDDTSIAFEAWEWTSNMGAPAALVAAAVLVTLSETRLETSPTKADKTWIRFLKRCMRFLLMSSFALEVGSIFVGNMTGSMLLGHGPQTAAKKIVGYMSPLQLLHHHHELEYLFTQISFLQGLIHWLGAVVCELMLPKPTETTSAKRMNKCLASWLVTMVLTIMAFYNDHINFYSDYAHMLRRFLVLLLLGSRKYRFRPMSLLYGPSFLISTIFTWQAFTSSPKEDD